jgi:hypothetical protein
VAKDLKSMEPQIRKKTLDTIKGIQSGDPLVLQQTHPLVGKMKGWSGTKVSRGYRVVHQPTGNQDGGIYFGYVGLHVYEDAIQRLTSLETQQSYSTAFTAPGYYHDYSHPEDRKTAALHDISKPHWNSGWGNSREENEVSHEQYVKDTDDFHARVRKEKAWPDDEPSDYEVGKEWEKGMRRALTMGHLDIREAEKRGYTEGGQREHGDEVSTYEDYFSPDEQKRKGGWKPLPKDVYHVSTDADSVQKQGLRTRSQLGQRFGKGLGGGSDDTVSVTSDPDLATDVYHALHEHHAVATGKITPQQLLEYAKHPPEGVEPFDDHLVKGMVGEESFDYLCRGVKDNHSGYGDDQPKMTTRSKAAQEHPDWLPVETSRVRGFDTDGREPLYTHWERPLTKDEHIRERSEFYKSFSTARQHAGGHRDPLFISNDALAFSKADPEKFGILHLHSHKGAQGYPLNTSTDGAHHNHADSGEWRLGEGSPFDIASIDRPTPRHLSEFGDQQHTASRARRREGPLNVSSPALPRRALPRLALPSLALPRLAVPRFSECTIKTAAQELSDEAYVLMMMNLEQHTAADKEEIPADPGTTPIPEGHVRLWHYTGLWNLDSIREHGLLASKARGDGGSGPNEASSGVWASTRAPEDWQRALHVEFHAPLSDISQRASDPWREMSGLDEPGSFGKGYHHVIMKGSVRPEQILGLHEPWHASVRMIRDNGGPDQYDDMMGGYKEGEPTGHRDTDDAVRAYHYLKNTSR